MPAKRIRSHVQATTGGGGGTTTINTPSARWSEDTNVDDALAYGLIASPENTNVDDALAYIMVKEGEDTNTGDDWSQFVLSAFAEDTNVNDLARIQLLTVDVSRTGTPDSDLMFDAYTNQLAAFAATNFGNVSPIACRGVTTVSPGSDEQRAYIAIDLTGYSGFTGLNLLSSNTSAFTLVLQIANSNLLTATNITCTFTRSAAKPFTESTVTWNAPPTIGTVVNSTNLSIASGGGFAAYTFAITAASLGAVLGQWLLCTFTGPSAATTALVDTFTIKSRDDATTGNRPKFSLTVQRGT